MAITQDMQQRIVTLATQWAAEELGEIDDRDALSWLDAVESRAVEIGDALATELVKQRAALQPPVAAEANCPECGKAGRYQGQRKRQLVTTRGPTTIAEPQYHCPCCRKDFFPSDPNPRG